MKTLEDTLSEIEFFKGFSEEHMALLAGCAKNVKFGPSEFIFHEGEKADTFYLIRHGKVALEVHAPNQGALTIQTIEEGDELGWSWMFDPYKRQFDARAMTLVRAISFDARCLRDRLESDHDLGYALLQRFAQIVVERLSAARLQLLDMYKSYD